MHAFKALVDRGLNIQSSSRVLSYLFKMSTPSAILPPELILLVMDHCIGEPATLHACSLVARSWRCQAQRRLLARIWINHGQFSIKRTLDAAYTFLDSNTRVAGYVRDVVLRRFPSSSRVSDIGILDLQLVLSKIPNLHSLFIDNLYLASGLPSTIRPTSEEVTVGMKLNTLRMELISLYRAGGQDRDTSIGEPLVELFKYFTEVDTLDISRPWRATGHLQHGTGPITNSYQQSQANLNLPRIRALRISRPPEGFVNHLSRCFQLFNVEELYIDDKGERDGKFDDRYQSCITIATSVKQLHIRILTRTSPLLSISPVV